MANETLPITTDHVAQAFVDRVVDEAVLLGADLDPATEHKIRVSALSNFNDWLGQVKGNAVNEWLGQ